MTNSKFETAIAGIFFSVLVGGLYGAAEGQEAGSPKLEVQVEEGLVSVSLNEAPAGDVFQTIARKGKIVIRLSNTLLDVPLSEELEGLPLEKGLRRLIARLGNDYNVFKAYGTAGPDRELRLLSLDILARGSPGAVQEFSARKGLGETQAKRIPKGEKRIPKGLQEKMARGLPPGHQKILERTGKLPGEIKEIPEGLLRKLERGEPLPPGIQRKLDRYQGR